MTVDDWLGSTDFDGQIYTWKKTLIFVFFTMTDADAGGGGAQLKFGFSKTVQQRKVAVQVAEKKDEKRLITGIEGSVIKTLEPDPEQEGKKIYVVPKLENSYRTGFGKKFTPSFKPPANDAPIAGEGEDRFVAAAEDTRPTITQYGLEQRARPGGAPEEPAAADRPLVSAAQLEHEAYKRDMEELPDVAPVEVGGRVPHSKVWQQPCMHTMRPAMPSTQNKGCPGVQGGCGAHGAPSHTPSLMASACL